MIQLTERQRLIIEDLLNNSSHIPAKALAKKFNVSVRTIRYDLDNIEYWLRARNIPLIKKPNAGVWLDLKDAAREELKREIGHIDPCEGVLTRDERHYLVLLELLRSVNPLTADFLADGARIYRIPIPESEIANIAFHLLSANLKMEYLSGENIPEEEDVLKCAVDEMLENAGKLRDYLVPGGANLEKLKKDLLSHLKLTVKKHRLNIEIENPLLDQIKANYTDIFETAREMADIFASKTDIRLPEAEIGYIALHLAAHIETYRQKSKKKALIVCTTGQGSAKILATRIKNRIPELEIKGINSVFELEEDGSLLRDADFIVSTVHLKVFDKPVVKVSPIITNEELEKIRKVVYDGKTAAHYSVFIKTGLL